MSEKQKALFLGDEGDAWFARNKQALTSRSIADDPVLNVIGALGLAHKTVLEVGCADGWRLRGLSGAVCSGVDPSVQAVAEGMRLAPQHMLKVGTADALDFVDEAFDLGIYGFCLYLCDRDDLFKVAMEGDRVLADGGHIIVYDFCTDVAYRNAYSHKPGFYSYKMHYADLFRWNPVYRVVHHALVSHGGAEISDAMDDRVAVTVLCKNTKDAYPDNPYAL